MPRTRQDGTSAKIGEHEETNETGTTFKQEERTMYAIVKAFMQTLVDDNKRQREAAQAQLEDNKLQREAVVLENRLSRQAAAVERAARQAAVVIG